MKDRAIQSPMEKVKVNVHTLNINWFEKYFEGFHFNQFGTLSEGAPFISQKFTNKDHPNDYVIFYS